MIDTARLENLSAESRIVYSYFITNEYANIALGLAVDYLNLEFDFDDAVNKLAKEMLLMLIILKAITMYSEDK